MRDTVLGETPARSATMDRVARRLTSGGLDGAGCKVARFVEMLMRF
jgi:hypothetical protein